MLVDTARLHADLVAAAVEAGGRVRVLEDVAVTRCAAFVLRDVTVAVDVDAPGVAFAVLVPGTCAATSLRPGLLRVRYRAPALAD